MQTRSTARLAGVRQASRSAPQSRLAVRAQAGPSNQIGIHAQVWVGDWSKDEAVKAIKGTKDAGYDIIERESLRLDLRHAIWIANCPFFNLRS